MIEQQITDLNGQIESLVESLAELTGHVAILNGTLKGLQPISITPPAVVEKEVVERVVEAQARKDKAKAKEEAAPLEYLKDVAKPFVELVTKRGTAVGRALIDEFNPKAERLGQALTAKGETEPSQKAMHKCLARINELLAADKEE